MSHLLRADLGVGDVFVMNMYYSEPGDYEMNNHVVEYEVNRRIEVPGQLVICCRPMSQSWGRQRPP
jgi:hypothetical protein